MPLHEFLLRVRAQIFWCWNRLDEAEECCYKGLDILGRHSPEVSICTAIRCNRISLSRGEIDKASKFIDQIQHLLRQSTYHVDWTANASLSLILFWQVKGDKNAIRDWLSVAVRPESASNHFCQLSGEIL